MKLHIKNFRSIKQLDLELAPITVLYGHNGTGKSSTLYAPLTMRNIVDNPNQEISGFFNYGFTSLGSFEEVVFDHNTNNELELGISLEAAPVSLLDQHGMESGGYDVVIDYHITCQNNSTGALQFKIILYDWEGDTKTPIDLMREVNFPDRKSNYELLKVKESEKTFTWNGISTNEVALNPGDEWFDANPHEVVNKAIEYINLPIGKLQQVSFVPLGRGFFQPLYSLKSRYESEMTPEREVTDLLASERHLEYAVSQRMEQILNRDFRVRGQIGTNDFSLDSIDRKSSISASLVNEGFGVNQLVYMLAKVLHPDAGIVCIEEPEIHLHPTAIRRLVHALAEIVGESGDKRLLISTHSKQFIMSLLALVADGTHSPDDFAVYMVTKDEKASEFHRQQVKENGQIEGGFASFIEGELEDMKVFLGV